MNAQAPDNTIDLPTFSELQDAAGADFVTELVEAFFAETPAILTELRTAHAADDLVRFRRAAHSIKSNCQTLGATQLGHMARALELGEVGADETALAALEQEYTRVVAELTRLCHG
jgi:HPt (histidine-containing phosphotransfer) domain-containing protein